jgi:hypothetical protein
LGSKYRFLSSHLLFSLLLLVFISLPPGLQVVRPTQAYASNLSTAAAPTWGFSHHNLQAAAKPASYFAHDLAAGNNSQSGDAVQPAVKKQRVHGAAELTSSFFWFHVVAIIVFIVASTLILSMPEVKASSATSPGESSRQVNLPEVSRHFLNMLNSRGSGRLESEVEFASGLKSLPMECWISLHANKRFQTLKQQCTPDSKELAHQKLLTFACEFMIEFLKDFLQDWCGLTVRDTSAKDYPVDPEHKVDLSFVVGRSRSGQVQWPDVVFGLEIKPEDLEAHLLKAKEQLCDFVSQLFYTDSRRTVVPAFAMTATKLRYFQFTRTMSDDLNSYEAMCTDEMSLFDGPNMTVGFCCLLHKLIKTPAALGYSILRTQHVVDTISAWLGTLRRPSPEFKIEPIKEPSRAGKPCLLKLGIPLSRHISDNVVAQQGNHSSLNEFNLLAPYPSVFSESQVCVFDIVHKAKRPSFFTVYRTPARCD